MRVLIATDAWHPQVNGVVRTLTSLAAAAKAVDAEIDFLTADGFRSWPLPTYPGLRIALPSAKEIARRIERCAPEALHIATEGPIGWAARAYCRRNRLAFTTSYTTRFPEYVSVRTGIPAAVGYAVLRHFHDAAAMTMVATPSLQQELAARGFKRLGFWGRGVNTELFHPDSPAKLDVPGPIFMTMGRVAVEKNLEAFLSLDLPGTKVVVGDGPQKAALEKKYPDVAFLGEKKGADLTAHLAAADVFVFPSVTDTFGVVQLEALACGTPVAAFPVTGPKDVIADHPIGAIDHDLRAACLRALAMSRETCRNFALERSWENSARQFVGNLTSLQPSRALRASPRMARRPVRGRSILRPTARISPMAKIMNLDGTQQLDLTRGTVEQAYDRWAPVYDLVFGGVFAKGRQAAIAATNKFGGRVLEVGVGTGISLPMYAPHLRIFGTDISEAMLDKARQRVTEGRLKNVEGLAVMDAEKLEFPDNSFDVVMAQYVVTAVPNPEKALDEFARVLRPGGELIILTRVSADAGMRRFIEQKLQPVVRPLGFRTAEFAWSRYAKWLAGAEGVELAERRLIPPLGHFSLVRFRKLDVAKAT